MKPMEEAEGVAYGLYVDWEQNFAGMQIGKEKKKIRRFSFLFDVLLLLLSEFIVNFFFQVWHIFN